MMKQIIVIVKKDLKETLRTRAFYFSIAIVLFFMVMLGGVVRGQINSSIEQGLTPAEVIPVIQPLMGTLVFTLSLLVMMLFCLYISAYTLTMEKIKHSLESLLCTPLSLRQIWLGNGWHKSTLYSSPNRAICYARCGTTGCHPGGCASNNLFPCYSTDSTTTHNHQYPLD